MWWAGLSYIGLEWQKAGRLGGWEAGSGREGDELQLRQESAHVVGVVHVRGCKDEFRGVRGVDRRGLIFACFE